MSQTRICTFCSKQYQHPVYSGPVQAYDPSTCSLTCTRKAEAAKAKEAARAAD